jgi:hypothetical protein
MKEEESESLVDFTQTVHCAMTLF